MKKIIILLLTWSIFFTNTYTITHTNKTFMAVPSSHYNTAMKYMASHRLIKQGSSTESPWGSTLTVAPFYQLSNNKSNLGKYFGTNNKNEIKIDEPTRLDPPAEGVDVQSGLLFHKQTDIPDLKGCLKLEPEQQKYGVYFSYNQDLGAIHKGLFFRVNIPFEHVENDLHATVKDEVKHTKEAPSDDKEWGILDYFSGTYKNETGNETNNDNLQAPLCKAKICGMRSATGIADIEILFGYTLASKKEHEKKMYLKAIVPTGSKPDGEYLFQPIVGNGQHWGLGTGFDGSMNITKGEDYSLECLFGLNFTYLFKETEKRTLGYRTSSSFADNRKDIALIFPWSYYLLGGEVDKKQLFPLANVLTQDVSVLPAGRLHGHTSFAYHRSNTTFDFGYAFYAQEGEKVSIKCWKNNTYGLAKPDHATRNDFSLTNGDIVAGGAINKLELDPNTAATPAVFRQSIHGGVCYTLSEWENPFMIGCGFSVDWTQDNTTPTGYTIWAKAGGSF